MNNHKVITARNVGYSYYLVTKCGEKLVLTRDELEEMWESEKCKECFKE